MKDNDPTTKDSEKDAKKTDAMRRMLIGCCRRLIIKLTAKNSSFTTILL